MPQLPQEWMALPPCTVPRNLADRKPSRDKAAFCLEQSTAASQKSLGKGQDLLASMLGCLHYLTTS